jgi:hypothetical protein
MVATLAHTRRCEVRATATCDIFRKNRRDSPNPEGRERREGCAAARLGFLLECVHRFVHLWKAKSGHLIHTEGHAGGVGALASRYSPKSGSSSKALPRERLCRGRGAVWELDDPTA